MPPNFKETDLEGLLSKHGQVISTRILRDQQGLSKGELSNAFYETNFPNRPLLPPTGVGFARMESREKCEQIIQQYNGSSLPGGKDALLVKFADGGSKKKNTFKNQDPNSRGWRDVTEVSSILKMKLVAFRLNNLNI